MKAGLVAAIVVALPGVAHGAVINDPAGDANGIGNTGLSVATGPVSDASRDLTSVSIDRTLDGLVVRYTLSAPPADDSAPTFAILRGTRGACGVSLAVMWGLGDGPVAVSDLDDCDEEFLGIGAPGYSATTEGSTVVARFPYAALAGNRMGIGPSTALTGLRAETRVGTFHTSGGFVSCDPDCENEGFSYAKSGFLGPLVDITDEKADLSPQSKTLRSIRGKLRKRR